MLSPIIRITIIMTYVLFGVTLLYAAAEPDPYKAERCLRYPGSYDIHPQINGPFHDWQITYKVNLPYPSRDVFSFYEGHLRALGWSLFDDDPRHGTWQTFMGSTKDGSPWVHQLISKWRKGDVILVLRTAYYSSKSMANQSHPDNDIEKVDVVITRPATLPPPPSPETSVINSKEGHSEPYKREESLRYPGSVDIRTQTTEPYNVWQIQYKVHLKYPSKDVLAFYDNHLASLGWVQFAEDHYESSYRAWQSFIDQTYAASPRVYQLLAKWTKDDRMILLEIRCYSSRSTSEESPSDSNVQEVVVVIGPFIKYPPLPLPEDSNSTQTK